MKFLIECPCFSCFCFIKKTKKSKPKEKDEKGSWSRFIHVWSFSHCRNQSFVFRSKVYVVRFDEFLSKRLRFLVLVTHLFQHFPSQECRFPPSVSQLIPDQSEQETCKRKKEGQNPLAVRRTWKLHFALLII